MVTEETLQETQHKKKQNQNTANTQNTYITRA
jgi:hypothetical protein